MLPAWGVLHYDSDYDLLAKDTSLRFESEWLTQPGTLWSLAATCPPGR